MGLQRHNNLEFYRRLPACGSKHVDGFCASVRTSIVLRANHGEFLVISSSCVSMHSNVPNIGLHMLPMLLDIVLLEIWPSQYLHCSASEICLFLDFGNQKLLESVLNVVDYTTDTLFNSIMRSSN